ncbi:hypothetical protein Tco_1387031 [Tanacetum coccineum]
MCHIVGIEPQFKKIITDGPYVPMSAGGLHKPKARWSDNERKAANLDQRLKSLIMSVLPDDQMNSVINCKTAKATLEDLILYHEGPSHVKENMVMDLNLPKKWLSFCLSLRNANRVRDFDMASLFELEDNDERNSNKVNQCISEQIPNQKRKILGADQLNEELSSCGQKDLVFVKSSSEDSNCLNSMLKDHGYLKV